MLPNFLIVGGQRCGTTYLWGLLKQHPQIFMSEEKETQYFGELLQDKGYPIQQYKHHFAAVRNEIAIGEASVENMFLDGIAPLISQTLGNNIRLIFLLRNPIDRAYSHYWMMIAKYREYLPFEKALRAEPHRIHRSFHDLRSYSYISRGYYATQIQRYLRYFPRERMLFLLSDDLYNHTDQTLSSICRHLGVTEHFRFEKSVDKYSMPIPKNITLFRLLNFVQLSIKEKPGYWKIRAWQNKLLDRKNTYPPMQETTRIKLQEYYLNANQDLGHLLGKDLSH